jgi:ABC-2 type transport system ATP-binding protein
MNAIELEGVRKSFGKNHVLKGVTGTLEKGKVAGLLGRNGEGKTTLFKIMLDILQPDTGRILVSGQIPDGSAKIRQTTGYIPERPVFHEFMTVQEVLKLREGFFPSWDWNKARQMAEQFELELTTPIRGASKGTLAKVAWICATAHHPAVLLLDEPTAGLDIVVRDSVLTHLIREMAEEGKTIMVANHHMEELLGILDEVWILMDGVIQEVHELERLKNEACRITGRLKFGAQIPADLFVVQEQSLGGLVQWVVLNKETVGRIRQIDLLDQMETESVPLETTFKVLLTRTAGSRPRTTDKGVVLC